MTKKKAKELHIRIKNNRAQRYAQALAILDDQTLTDYVTNLILEDAGLRGLTAVLDAKTMKELPKEAPSPPEESASDPKDL